MVVSDVQRILALKQEITTLEAQLLETSHTSTMAQRLASIPGFGLVAMATLADEIGTLARRLFKLLRKTYVDARYKRNYTITSHELLLLAEQVEALKETAKLICNEKINSF